MNYGIRYRGVVIARQDRAQLHSFRISFYNPADTLSKTPEADYTETLFLAPAISGATDACHPGIRLTGVLLADNAATFGNIPALCHHNRKNGLDRGHEHTIVYEAAKRCKFLRAVCAHEERSLFRRRPRHVPLYG